MPIHCKIVDFFDFSLRVGIFTPIRRSDGTIFRLIFFFRLRQLEAGQRRRPVPLFTPPSRRNAEPMHRRQATTGATQRRADATPSRRAAEPPSRRAAEPSSRRRVSDALGATVTDALGASVRRCGTSRRNDAKTPRNRAQNRRNSQTDRPTDRQTPKRRKIAPKQPRRAVGPSPNRGGATI